MSQTYTANSFDASFDWDDTLQSFEDNDKAFASSFSGTSAPASPEAGRLWFNTATGHQGLRVRNSANNAWHKVLTGTAATKIWIYANTAVEGWVIDWNVQDRVVAVRSGTDNGAYYASGGTSTEGLPWASLDAWFDAIDAHVHAGGSHAHMWYNNIDDSGTNDQSFNSSGVLQDIATGTTQDKANTKRGLWVMGEGAITGEYEGTVYAEVLGDMYVSASGTQSGSASTTLTAPADPRPAAALGLVMYPDLT